jgi:hypothetical protein
MLQIYRYKSKNIESDYSISLMTNSATGKMVIYNGAKYGAIAGFVATWSISTAIAASEFELGLQIGTFYSVMGIALGFNNAVSSAYLSFGLHILTGSILGAIVGAIAIKWKKMSILNPYKGILIGVGAGIAIWLILFLPITTLLIQPSIDRIVTVLAVQSQKPLLSDNVNQSIRGIALSAIVFHMGWGAIFGFMISSMLRIKALKSQIWKNGLKNKKGDIDLQGSPR